jgi:hypoxanthine-guanine phosphoribosyltransferase
MTQSLPKTLISEQQILAKVDQLADQIYHDYQEIESLTTVCVLQRFIYLLRI